MKHLLPFFLVAASVITAAAVPPPPEDLEPNFDQPEGTTYLLSRDCEAFEIEAYEAIHGRCYGSIVEITDGDDGAVYFSYIISSYPASTYIKGERTADGKVVIKGPQALYEEYDYDYDKFTMLYLVPLVQYIDENNRGYYIASEDMEYVFDVKEDGTLVSEDPTKLLGICTWTYLRWLEEEGYYWTGWGDRDITISRPTGELVTPPADIASEKWVWEDEYETTVVNVMFDDKDVYIQGMDRILPNAWLKGSVTADNEISFPSGQFMGASMEDLYFHYFCGGEFTEVAVPDEDTTETQWSLKGAAAFRYDAEKRHMHDLSGYVINGSPDKLYPLYGYHDVTIEHQDRNPECPPAAPYDLVFQEDDLGKRLWVQIPNTDTEGMMLDEANLYYEIFLDGEPYELDIDYPGIEEHPTWVPYNFENDDVFIYGKDHTIYFYTEGEDSYGIRSVYVNEMGQVLYSAACGDCGNSLVAGVKADVESVVWYDLTGRRIEAPAKGVSIRSVRYSDGSLKSEKVMVLP
ncbi:MAG: hypothetical protein K2F87_03195 [Muribaculaceae bacterium]|nr:hypothetical protein [Muribaculaceae bacterium]